MEDIRFVLEAPQHSRTQKKRPRLVTSCDNCRTKKIKCIQSGPNVVCEACTTARLPCRFRDRERYFAERSKMVSSATSKSTAPQKQHAEMVINSELAPANTSIDGPLHPQGGVARSSAKRATNYHPYHISVNASSRNSTPSDHSLSPPPPPSLFEPKQPNRPRSTLMMTLIQSFFDRINPDFPFLAYDETLRRFFNQELTILQANCIAAHAARYAEAPEITARGVMFVTDQFCDNAKALTGEAIAMGPDLDTVHSLILLAWIECYRNRLTEFCHYGQMAVLMARQLGLADQNFINMASSEYEQTILQSTWTSISHLETSVQPYLNVRV